MPFAGPYVSGGALLVTYTGLCVCIKARVGLVKQGKVACVKTDSVRKVKGTRDHRRRSSAATRAGERKDLPQMKLLLIK